MHFIINKKIEFKSESFFDYWHYNNVDEILAIPPKKIAEKIAEKIRLQKIQEQLPEHCVQLLFLS